MAILRRRLGYFARGTRTVTAASWPQPVRKHQKPGDHPEAACKHNDRPGKKTFHWNCASSIERARAFTLDQPPWITVVNSSK